MNIFYKSSHISINFFIIISCKGKIINIINDIKLDIDINNTPKDKHNKTIEE